MYRQTFYMLIRRFLRNPLFSGITLANLAVGFATFILLGQFLSGMLNYDKHNEKYDRIYRVQLFQDQQENIQRHSWSIPAALSRNELSRIPEIEKVALMHDVGDNNKNGVFLSPDKESQFLVRYGYYADQSILDIFTFHFISGDPVNALTRPNTIILSETIAKRLFPNGDATGKQIYGENKVILTVTGVYEDVPKRTHWEPAYIITMLSYAEFTNNPGYEDNYMAYAYYTYVLLKPNASPLSVDEKIHDALKNFRKEHIPYLRPMSALSLRPYFENDMIIALLLFTFIALLILVLSSINYINLQTAASSTRFREIGIKKATGFTKKKLWFQFMFESILLAMIGAVIGITIAHLSFQPFNQMIGGEIISDLFSDPHLIGIVLIIALLTGFLSGIHPAYVITKFNPVSALKQKLVQEQSNGISLKKILVTLQFSISIFLLAVGFIVFRQSKYMVNKEMGFESHNLVFANIITNKEGSFESLRKKLLAFPEIRDACQSDYIPYILPGGNELNWEGAADTEEKVFVRFYNVSHDFVSTYDMKIVQGRDFSRDYPADFEKCLLNETALKVFGWSDITGRSMEIWGKNYDVIGVIKDHVAFSVHNKLEPHLYRLIGDSIENDNVYSVRFTAGHEKEVLKYVTDEFKEFFPDDAFEFKNIRSRITTENASLAWARLMKISIFFALLSIIISSIGLFGLVLFYTRNKLKEIGVRKVLGFSFGHLYFRMSWDFVKLMLISIIIAWPAAFYVYGELPGNKYPLGIWEFIIATAITLVVAILTISYQIIKALKVRPIEILKDE